MARTGRFGRLPRTAPNLASTIVQMVREVNAQEDSNMLQAWEEGGLFKGEKVTDKMLLDHFRKRRDSMSKTDPLWDKWNTSIQNYEFAIEESKMSLKYAEKKVDDTAMANFYRKWAGKLPVDSEAYRNLMRSAAQFADAAKARAGGGGGGRGRGRSGGSRRSGNNQEAYNAAAMGAYDRYEKKWDDANYYLLNAAYRAGILQITDTTDPDDLMDLRGGDEADHQRFLDLFDAIQTDPYYADIKEAMAAEGLGGLTYAQFLAAGDSKEAGLDARIRIARTYGDDKGVKDLTEEKIEFVTTRAIVNDIDEFAWYQTTRRDLDDRIAAGGLSPFEVRDLLGQYASGLSMLRDSATSEQTRGFLNNELRALQGEDVVGPTMFEGTEGGIRTREGGDGARYAALLRTAENAVRMIESGQAFLTAGVTADGIPDYGVITKDDLRLRDPLAGRVIFNSAGAGENRTIPTFVQFQPMYVAGVTGMDPRTGLPSAQVTPAGSEALGVTYTLNGHTYYGVMAGGNGSQMLWFADNPFAEGTQQEWGEDGLTVSRRLTDADLTMDPSGRPVFDPMSVLEERARNMDLTYTKRYDSALEAVYDTDPIARQALLRASDADLAIVAEASPAPEETWAELRVLRNEIVDRHQMRIAQRGIFGAAQQGRETEALATRIAASEEHFERTGESKAEKARALELLRQGEEWEARYRQMNPASASANRRQTDRSEIRPVDPRTGLPLPEDVSGARVVAGSWGRNTTPLPQIKVPQIGATTATPQQSGPRPVDQIGGPLPVRPQPAPPPPVTPRPVAPPPTPPAPTPTTPTPIDDVEQPWPDTPTTPTPPVRQPIPPQIPSNRNPVIR